MLETLMAARRKFGRDRQLPLRHLLGKSARYARELALARVYLRDVDELGRGVRAAGRPRIENLGFMSIGEQTLVRSVNVPVELCTGLGAELRVGRECSLNYGLSVGAVGQIHIGDRVRIGPYAMIVDSDFHDPYDRQARPAPRPVHIEDDVWIGAKACVMAGVRLGRGAIVGTGAVVTRDVEPLQVVGGVPAKLIRTLDAAEFAAHNP